MLNSKHTGKSGKLVPPLGSDGKVAGMAVRDGHIGQTYSGTKMCTSVGKSNQIACLPRIASMMNECKGFPSTHVPNPWGMCVCVLCVPMRSRSTACVRVGQRDRDPGPRDLSPTFPRVAHSNPAGGLSFPRCAAMYPDVPPRHLHSTSCVILPSPLIPMCVSLSGHKAVDRLPQVLPPLLYLCTHAVF